jgi:hypothetical protein
VDSRRVKKAMTPPQCQVERIEGDVVRAGYSSAAPGLAIYGKSGRARPPKSELRN